MKMSIKINEKQCDEGVKGMEIVEIRNVDECKDELSDLLIKVVEEGASIGFLPPLKKQEADDFWKNCVSPDIMFWVAKIDGAIAATIQLHLCKKPNGTHRAEVAKLMTHPAFRQKGIGRKLLLHAEQRAKEIGLSLLVLDTREGDPSNLLYQSFGFQEAGRIPFFAKNEKGGLDTTVLYYKSI